MLYLDLASHLVKKKIRLNLLNFSEEVKIALKDVINKSTALSFSGKMKR